MTIAGVFHVDLTSKHPMNQDEIANFDNNAQTHHARPTDRACGPDTAFEIVMSRAGFALEGSIAG